MTGANRAALTLITVAGVAAAAAIARTHIASLAQAKQRSRATEPSVADVLQLFSIADRPEEELDYIIELFCTGPKCGDLTEDDLRRLYRFFPTVPLMSDSQLETLAACLVTPHKSVATAAAALLRALVLGGRRSATTAFTSEIAPFVLGIVGDVTLSAVRVNIVQALADIVSDAKLLIPCFTTRSAIDGMLSLAFDSEAHGSESLRSAAVHYLTSLTSNPLFATEVFSLGFANILWDGINNKSLDISHRDDYFKILTLLMINEEDTNLDLLREWAARCPEKQVVELLRSDQECLVSAGHLGIVLMFITNTRADDLLSLGADFLDPYVSSFSLCTSNLANGSLSTILFANDSMAKELISSGRMRQLVTDQAVVSNLELLGALQCALTSANPEFFDDIRDQLKDTGFIQLGYDHLDQVQSTPVAMPFLLTFDPDARGKLLDLYIQQCATVAPDLAASTIDDPAAFREFLTAICSFLFVSKPSDELQVRERLIREGDLLDILRISALEPSLRGYPIIFHVVDALCYDEALIPTVVAAFHLPLLSHWHSSILELISATKEILVTVRKQSVPVDDHSIMAAEELLVSTLVWFHHSFLRSLNPQVVQVLVEQQDGGLLQAVDCLKQLLELNVLDSKQRPYYSQDNPRALDLYYATNDSVGNEWSDALDEANAYISFNETHNVIYSIVSATCTALSHLSHFDLLRPRCLDILPLLPGILFNRGQNIRFFYQTALQAPLKVLDQYYKTLSFHYRVAAEQKYPVKSKDALAMLEGMNRVFVRNSTVDSVHWASMTGGVQTCARGSTVFNFSAHQQQVRGSHGVTGKGKYCYTVSFPEKAGITLGWTTNAGPLVWNQNLYMQEPTSNGEGAPQTVVINFEVAAAWKSGKFRNSVDYATANSFITCILDLDNGQFIYGVDQLPFRVVFSNLDRSQTWFPVIYPMSRSVIETNFSESIRESSGIPLGSAPISDLIRHPDARSPIPTASDSTDARREYLPITVDGLPLTPKALSKLVLRNYYETELTPSFTDPLLAVGFRQGLTYTLWVSTRQIELALQFALDDHVTAVEHSAQWCTWIPALIKYFGQNRSVSPPEAAFGVMFAEDGSVAGLVDVGSNDTAQAQIVVCGYAVREGCDLDSVEPTCSSPINFGVAILLDKKGSRLFTVTKGLAPIVKEGMFPLLLADGEEDFFTPLIINAFGVTLKVHMDVEAKEPWKLKGPLLQGRSDDDLVVWYENMETRR